MRNNMLKLLQSEPKNQAVKQLAHIWPWGLDQNRASQNYDCSTNY